VGNGRGQVHVGLGCTPACRLALLSVLGLFLPFTGAIVNLIAMYPWVLPPLFVLNTIYTVLLRIREKK
jgi:hypothetical protein